MKKIYLGLGIASTALLLIVVLNGFWGKTSDKQAKVTNSNFWDIAQERRSVRKFKPDSVPNEDIIKIIDAARMAPTAGNQQPWKFLVIQDRQKIELMKQECLIKSLQYYDNMETKTQTREEFEKKAKVRIGNYCSAPAYIVVLTDNNSKYPTYNNIDGPIAAGYLLLAAKALGYGTVYITDAISEEVTKKAFDIPDNYTRVCITPIGIPEEWPQAPHKKELEEFILWDKF